MNSILAASNPLDHVVSHDLFTVGGVIVTNHMIMAGVSALLMLILFPWLFAKPKPETPSGLRNFFESILVFLREDVFRPALKDKTDRFAPFLWTVFFFILFANLLGFIPIGEVFRVLGGGHPSELMEKLSEAGGTATGNIATTAALAVCALIFIHLNGMMQVFMELRAGTYGHHAAHGDSSHAEPHGDGDHAHPHGKGIVPALFLSPVLYIWNFAPHLFKPQPGEPATRWLADIPVWGLLLVLEGVGAMIKPFALCMRLFANMIAGHIVLAVLAGLIVLAPTVLSQLGIGIPVTGMSLMIRMLELFVCFLQAYIFTFLTTLFVAAAVAPEH